MLRKEAEIEGIEVIVINRNTKMGLEYKYYDWQQEYEQTSYSKKEVDEMLDDLYEGIIIEIEEKFFKKKGNKYYFRIKLKTQQIRI